MKQANPFDQFDSAQAPAQGNPFDQFDTTSAQPEKPKSFEEKANEFAFKAYLAKEAAIKGLEQGLSFGHSDEAKAALQAPLSDKTYEKLRDEERAQNKAYKELSPLSYNASEIIGGVAAPSPLSKLSAASKVGKVGLGLLKGAVEGGAAGEGYSDNQGGQLLDDTAKGAGIGIAANAAAPVIGKTISTVAAIPKTIVAIPKVAKNAARFVTGSLTDKGAQEAAQNYVAKQLTKEGITPEQLADKAATAQDQGLGVTLPEYARSSGLLSDQKQIMNSGGKASNYLRQYAEKRATETIPNKLQETAAPLVEKQKAAGQQYNDIFANRNVDVDITPVEEDLANKAVSANPGGTMEQLYKNLGNILDSAKQKGGTLQAYHNAKLEIDNMIQSAPTPGIKSMLKKETVDTVNQLKNAMDTASPEYAATRRLYEEGSAGNKVLNAMKKSRTGSIADIRSRLFGTQEKQDALKKSMSPAEFAGLKNVMGGIDDIIAGKMGGSDAAFNQIGKEELQAATGAQGVEMATKPLNAAQRLAKWYTDKVRQRDYEAIAKVFTNPDIAALGERMKGVRRYSPEGQKALNEFSARALNTYANSP